MLQTLISSADNGLTGIEMPYPCPVMSMRIAHEYKSNYKKIIVIIKK